MTVNFKEVRVGGFFILVGLAFGIQAYLKIPIGSPARMGPGFFPVVLSVVLVSLGLLIALQTVRAVKPANESRMNFVPWRGLGLILLAPIVFGYTVRGLGFVPAVAITTALAALSSPGRSPVGAAALALGMAAFCTVVFILAAGLPIDLFGPWLMR